MDEVVTRHSTQKPHVLAQQLHNVHEGKSASVVARRDAVHRQGVIL